MALMLVAGATVDALIPFYAIGVFTGFAMAGFGMARYHRRTRERGWRRKLVINLAGGIYTALVVLLSCQVTAFPHTRAPTYRPPTLLQLCRQWVDAGTGIPLELADCPDRRLAHAAARLATSLAAAPGTHVTVVLPRRCYPPLAGRLLHDHTADRIARVVSRVPDAAAVSPSTSRTGWGWPRRSGPRLPRH